MASTPANFFAPERWRKRVSFLFAAIWLGAALVIRPAGFQTAAFELLKLLGYLLLIVAALGRVWAFAYIGGRKDQELCRSGPYGMTRNPLYVFSFLGVCGAGLGLQSLALFATAAVFFLAYYAIVIRSEERRLAEIFGPAFTKYCAEVPRFWPRLRVPQSDSASDNEPTLSPRLVKRCLRDVFWFLAAIVLIEFIALGKANQWWHVWTTPF